MSGWLYAACPGFDPRIKPPPREEQMNESGICTWHIPYCQYQTRADGEVIRQFQSGQGVYINGYTHNATERYRRGRELVCIEHKVSPELFTRPGTAGRRSDPIINERYKRNQVRITTNEELSELFPRASQWQWASWWEWIGPPLTGIHSNWGQRR